MKTPMLDPASGWRLLVCVNRGMCYKATTVEELLATLDLNPDTVNASTVFLVLCGVLSDEPQQLEGKVSEALFKAIRALGLAARVDKKTGALPELSTEPADLDVAKGAGRAF